MKKTETKKTIQVKITFTEGYEERFTKEILKIFAKRMQRENEKQRVAG